MDGDPQDVQMRPRRKFWTLARRDATVGYVFILPQVVGFAIFVGIPVAMVVWFSLNDWNLIQGNPTFIGLGNYSAMLRDPEIGSVITATVIVVGGYVPLNIGVGLALAMAMNRVSRWIGLYRTLLFSPVVISAIAWTVIWRYILAPNGILNAALGAVGAPTPNWLFSNSWALFWVVIVQVLKGCGISMFIFLAGLQGVPDSVKEAASVDGAGRWTTFSRITLPLITPTVFMMVILSTVDALKVFAIVYWLTFGGPGSTTKVLSFYIYDQAFLRFEIGYASALSVVLLVIVLMMTVAQFMTRRRWVFAEDGDK